MSRPNPHLEMANDVFNRMFGLPIIAPPDPIPDLETAEGIVGLQSDNADIEQSESSFYPLNLPTLSPDEIAEGDARQEHC
jgi:hypothetical protein